VGQHLVVLELFLRGREPFELGIHGDHQAAERLIFFLLDLAILQARGHPDFLAKSRRGAVPRVRSHGGR